MICATDHIRRNISSVSIFPCIQPSSVLIPAWGHRTDQTIGFVFPMMGCCSMAHTLLAHIGIFLDQIYAHTQTRKCEISWHPSAQVLRLREYAGCRHEDNQKLRSSYCHVGRNGGGFEGFHWFIPAQRTLYNLYVHYPDEKLCLNSNKNAIWVGYDLYV